MASISAREEVSTGRAACHGCGEKIPKTETRIVSYTHCRWGIRGTSYHKRCYPSDAPSPVPKTGDDITKDGDAAPEASSPQSVCDLLESPRPLSPESLREFLRSSKLPPERTILFIRWLTGDPVVEEALKRSADQCFGPHQDPFTQPMVTRRKSPYGCSCEDVIAPSVDWKALTPERRKLLLTHDLHTLDVDTILLALSPDAVTFHTSHPDVPLDILVAGFLT